MKFSQKAYRTFVLAIMPLAMLAIVVLIPGTAHALDSLPDFTELVKKNHKAVVNISTRQRPDEDQEASLLDSMPDPESIPGLEGSPLEDLLKRYQEEQQPRGSLESNALGSGFIISEDGYVLTNNHVVADADEVIVRLHDRRQLTATVVGADPRSDVAVLKIDAADLPVVSIGNSDQLEVGEWVLAIGSPFGFDFSVTAGIVSATGRALPNESYVPFIQTDVAINPGNSGGPLFNLEGDVIGINSQIYSRTGSFMGLSFAIPIEMAMDVAGQIQNNGQVARGWLGVIIQEVTMELAESFGMKTAHGALVARILDDSPAESSELKVGDVITRFEDHRIERSSALPPLVGRIPANSDARLKVHRDGKSIDLVVNIGELPNDEQLQQSMSQGGSPSTNVLGLDVEPLDTETREQLGVDQGGVQASRVKKGGPADEAGISEGDVVLALDNKPVDSPEEFQAVLDGLAEQKLVNVLVQQGGEPKFLALKIDAD
ncbi:MAG: DegQ family serine endoprotease [Granulosicoccus sp.]